MKIFFPVLAALLIGLGIYFAVQRVETERSGNRQAIAQLDNQIAVAEAEFTRANGALRAELAQPVISGAGPDALTYQIERLEYLNARNERAQSELDRLKAKRAQLSK